MHPHPPTPPHTHPPTHLRRTGHPHITRLFLVFGLVLLLLTGSCQTAVQEDRTVETQLQRIVMIGASATHGFNVVHQGSQIHLAQVLDQMILVPHEPVQSHTDLFFFAYSVQRGSQLVEQALADNPTLIVGVDFLFWFGYGQTNREGNTLTSEEERLQLLEEGLMLLEQFTCPMVVGDFPDMTPAVGIMLAPTQMPASETLTALNQRLHEWANAKPHVRVFPLSRLVDSMRADQDFSIGSYEWPAGSSAKLLQPDQLHPTAWGLVAICQQIANDMTSDYPQQRERLFEFEPETILNRLETQITSDQ